MLPRHGRGYQANLGGAEGHKGEHLYDAILAVLELIPMVPQVGILTLFIKHTSASLSLNENYDPTVRSDMTRAMDHIVPEQGGIRWEHTDEGTQRRLSRDDKHADTPFGIAGLDDSASHTKASLLGSSVTIPITNGRMNVGTWQGVYLCEWRQTKHSRTIVATILP